MSISACIIAKNEESNIERCLRSLTKCCDEIILVDTGSKDSTIQIAESYDVKIFSHPWQGSFAEARNFSLEQASSEWILVIDCDEELTADSIEEVLRLSESKEIIGFGVIISNIINNVESYISVAARFFRNVPNIRYKGIVHENLIDTNTGNAPMGNFLTSKIKFIHYGYECIPELQAQKTNRNLTLLCAIPEKERDGMYYLHLGAEYTRLGDIKTASTTFEKGFMLTRPSEPYYTNIAHKFVDALFHQKQYNRCLMLIQTILENMPDFKCLYFIKAICHIELKQYPLALISLEDYSNIPHLPFKYPAIPFENNNDIPLLMSQLRSHMGLV